MSRRPRSHRLKRLLNDVLHKQSARQQHDAALSQVTDELERAQITAQYQRLLYGFIPIRDGQAHYLYELGLRSDHHDDQPRHVAQPLPLTIQRQSGDRRRG